ADGGRRTRGSRRQPNAARPRARADLCDEPGGQRAREAQGRGRRRRRREADRGRRAGGAGAGAAAGTAVVVVGLGGILFGRKKLKEPARDRLFALTTAAVTLDVSCGLKPTGVGAIVFKPLSAGEFTQVDQDVEQLLTSVATSQGSSLDHK